MSSSIHKPPADGLTDRVPSSPERAAKILPCPFCGSRAALNARKQGRSVIGSRFWRGWIKCSNNKCGATSILASSPDAAMRMWNRRPAGSLGKDAP